MAIYIGVHSRVSMQFEYQNVKGCHGKVSYFPGLARFKIIFVDVKNIYFLFYLLYTKSVFEVHILV